MSELDVIGVIYSSDLFRYNAATKHFSSEISNTPAVLRQLWGDSLDLGFGIRSKKTGHVVYFTLEKTKKDGDGAYLFWTFVIYNPDLDARLKGLSVTVYNDYVSQ